MAKRFKLPELPKMEKTHPHYVSRLEQGLIAVSGLVNEQQSAAMEIITEKIKDIPGIEIQDLSAYKIIIEIKSGERPAAVESLQQKKQELEADEQFIKVYDCLDAAQERRQDFRNALIHLTEITPLYQSAPQHQHNHLYILRPEMIYAACALPVPESDGVFDIQFVETSLDYKNFTNKKDLAEL